jgi:hypothetical protein
MPNISKKKMPNPFATVFDDPPKATTSPMTIAMSLAMDIEPQSNIVWRFTRSIVNSRQSTLAPAPVSPQTPAAQNKLLSTHIACCRVLLLKMGRVREVTHLGY